MADTEKDKMMKQWDEPTTQVKQACGHISTYPTRCAAACSKRICEDCAKEQLSKPSECLLRFLQEHPDSDNFGPMLGPIGAVIYARQSYFGFSGILAWSGTDSLHDVLDGFEPTRQVTPYIQLFQANGF